jgi:integrase
VSCYGLAVSRAGRWTCTGVELEAQRALVRSGGQAGVSDAACARPQAHAASLWLASGADAKVVQAVMGHFSAAMTMDVYGHLIAANLWESVARLGGHHRGTGRGALARRLSDIEGNGA